MYNKHYNQSKNVILTEDLINTFCTLSEAGANIPLICKCTGISLQQYARWMDAADNGDARCSKLRQMCSKSDISFVSKHLGIIGKAAETDWRAAERLLRGKFSSETSPTGSRIQIEQQVSINSSPIDQIMDMSKQILEQVASGAMTLEDAKIAMSAIEQTRRVAETLQIKERVDAIERKVIDASSDQ